MNNRSFYSDCMRLAMQEAARSLQEGNHGFGAVIAYNNTILCSTHDTDETEANCTQHAELKAIQMASSKIGKDLSKCTLISTHEPCPMCAGAIVWSKLPHIIYGYGIEEAIAQGRDRIGMGCKDIFQKSNVMIQVEKGLLATECALLYDRSIRNEIKKLRGATEQDLLEYNRQSENKRREWVKAENVVQTLRGNSNIEKAYDLLLRRFAISEAEAPIQRQDEHKIVFHSQNFCPTLEACKLLSLDTRKICKLYNERATDALVKHVDRKLKFGRNYRNLRPYAPYCEEFIEYDP